MSAESARNQKSACAYGLATVLLWSTVATAFKLSLRHLDPLQLLLCADAVSILALAAVLAATGRLSLLRAMPRREVVRNLAMGLLNPFLYYAILFRAYDLLPAQQAQPLNYTWAIALALLAAPMLGQRLTLRQLGAILVSYLGVVLISTQGDPFSLRFESPLGVGLALASTVIWALYWLLNAKSSSDPVAGLALNFLGAFPAILGATLAFSSLPPATLPGLAGAAYVGLFEMGLTFALWLKALRLAESAAKVGALIFLSPFLSLVFIHFFLGEAILPSTLAGLAFIVAGNVLLQAGGRT